MKASAEMPRYRCHKVVRALKIAKVHSVDSIGSEDRHTWIITPEDSVFATFYVPNDYIEKHNPQTGGYYVRYSDGYISYSPANAFEEGYTKI